MDNFINPKNIAEIVMSKTLMYINIRDRLIYRFTDIFHDI